MFTKRLTNNDCLLFFLFYFYSSKCKNPVFHHRDIFIEHDTQVWHKDCFRCHNCFITLSNAPMVDLNAKPCCERCLMAQSGEARQSRHAKLSYPATMSSSTNGGGDGDSTAASTPVLSSPLRDTVSSAGSAAFCLPRTPPPSRPRIDSVLFNHYQKSIQNESQPTGNATPPLLSHTPSTLSPAGSIRSSASASPVSVNSISPSPSPLSYSTSGTYTKMDSSTTPPPLSTSRPRRLSQQLQHMVNKTPVTSLSSTPSSSSLTKKPTKKSSSTLLKKTCSGCNEIIIGTKMKLATAEGDMWYHHNCLICAGCQGPFTDSICVRDGDKKIYHPKCQPLPSNVPQDEQLPRYQCHGCKQSIKDRCYTIGSRAYHSQCFRCFQCHDMLPPEFYEAYNEPHCEACINNSNANNTSPNRRSSMQTSSPRIPPRNNPKPFNSTSTPLLTSQRPLDHPSSVLTQRTRALPKFGGAKMCPRCHTSIAIMDEVKGPKATRWHRKCLRCAGCSKQMDMGARMSQDTDGIWLVHCRECMNNAGSKTKFVR
ncbi:hypothetical protein BDC45DRAFT_108885 [Circinella umbellata]|nr:hypothetical protein BDC45DRAFT_108885 [Circinella umbellata]